MTEIEYTGINDVVVRNHSSRVIPLWVNGKPPFRLVVSPTELAFGGHTIGVPSEPMMVILTNDGFNPLPIVSVVLEGKNYSLTGTVPKVVPVGFSVSLGVVFTPEDFFESLGTLTVDLGDNGKHVIPLTGAGAWDHTKAVDSMIAGLWAFIKRTVRPALTNDGPILSLSSSAVVFREGVEVGEQSEIMTITISNTGNRDLEIGDLLITGDFEILP